MTKNKKADDLLRMLGAKPSMHSPALVQNPLKAQREPAAKESKVHSPTPKNKIEKAKDDKTKTAPSNRGRAVQFYLHPEDEKQIREFVVWLAPHRKRINDTLIIKTVLRAAKTGPEFLAAYDKAVKVDGRLKRDR